VNPVALSVVIVPVVVTGVLGTRIAKSAGNTLRKTTCKTPIEPYIYTSNSFSTLSRTLIVKSLNPPRTPPITFELLMRLATNCSTRKHQQ